MTAYHLAVRPAWTCAVCGEDYPCRTRRAQLLDEFRGASIQLAMFMTIDFMDATADLPTVSAEELQARFYWYRC